MCIRHEQSIVWVVNIITTLSCTVFDNPKERLTFLFGIVDMFKEVIQDLHDYGDNGKYVLYLILSLCICSTKKNFCNLSLFFIKIILGIHRDAMEYLQCENLGAKWFWTRRPAQSYRSSKTLNGLNINHRQNFPVFLK